MTPETKETINQLSGQPHLMFWLSIPFVLIIGFSGTPQLQFTWGEMSWLIISREFAFLVSSVYLIIGLIYYALINRGRKLIKALTLLHTFFSLDLAVIFWFYYLLKRTSANGSYLLEISGFSEIIIISIAAGQTIFIINVLKSLIGSRGSEKSM